MSDNKHTPAPWRLVAESSGKGDIDYRIIAPNDQDGGTELARTVFSNDSGANAHLISAAPELLECCERVYNHLKVFDAGEGSVGVALKEAIEKATGK